MYAQYQQYNQNQSNRYQQQHQQSAQIVPPNPVATYTQYYHGWTKRVEELTRYLRTCTNGADRIQVESDCNWAKYYAEESSRAAHHFHQNPHATTAPFALPPAPPTPNSQNVTTVKSYASAAKSATQQNRKPSTTRSGGNTTPGTITRYVKRNIEREQVKNDPKLRKQVQSEIEKVIADAIQKNELASKNWDLVPLIPLPGEQAVEVTRIRQGSESSQPQQAYSGRHQYEHNFSATPTAYATESSRKDYYGPATSGGAKSSDSYYGSASSSGATSNGSYYGPAASCGMESNDSYYGPASSQNQSNTNDHTTHHSSHLKNKETNKSLSSSSFPGHKNKHKKNGKRHHEEDFISVGHYGPSTQSPGSLKPKKAKKTQNKKNMLNEGLDHSEQAMAKRASRFSGRGGIHEAKSANQRISHGIYSNSSKNNKYMGKGTIGGSDIVLDETDFENMTVKGTATTLEKEYLRLTAPPRAELVRPLEILQQHLRNLQCEYFGGKSDAYDSTDSSNFCFLQERMQLPQAKWSELSLASAKLGKSRTKHDYLWFCSQLKAIRQDCTVQRIQGDLAVDVYETHARIALQEGDLNEYNQCQTQLKELYDTIPSKDARNKSVLVRSNDHDSGAGDNDEKSSVWKHREEFIAYRLLYYVFLSTNEKYSGGSSDMYHIMLSLSPTQRNHPAVQHALKVREAVAFSDYFWFFRLHKTCPNLGVFLTELLVPSMRLRGLRRIAKAYRPSIDVDVCLKQLGFCDDIGTAEKQQHNNEDDGFTGKKAEEGKLWMISCGCVIEGTRFVTKDSNIHEPRSKDTKKNSLI